MLKRQNRLRREYLYKKSVQEQQATKDAQKKREKVGQILEEGKPKSLMSNQELKEARDVIKNLALDRVQHDVNDIDDEYLKAGVYDPKVVITTSRDPSSRLQQFAKEMRLIVPNSQRINRGNYVIKDLVETCRTNEVTDLVIIHEHRGEPDGLIVSHLPYGPTVFFTLYNVVLRHDIKNVGNMSEAYPHLIMDKFSSKLGKRIEKVLKHLFPVPKEDSKRVMTFANQSDFISFRHHVYVKTSHKSVELAEVGPRFEMRPYEIKLGTIDNPDSQTEWVLRSYMRTSRKRDQL